MLQMGMNYRDNRDGYAYGYSPNGEVEGLMNQLVMFRVPIARLTDRSSYEFFSGFGVDAGARWSHDITARKPVHTFPAGWVGTPTRGCNIVQSWLPSVVYNAPLNIYLMANWSIGATGQNSVPAPNCFGMGKPIYLGFYASVTPWGLGLRFMNPAHGHPPETAKLVLFAADSRGVDR